MIVPPPELQKGFYYVERLNRNCDEAKEALLKCGKELEDEAEDRKLWSHSETIHHSYIIGTCCDTITRIHEKYDVDILFRYKDSIKHVHEIFIFGTEHQAHAAKEEFIYIMQELYVHLQGACQTFWI